MALGDIWLAGASGDCSNAGTCPGGDPCGSEIITDCPAYWESVQTLALAYSPGSAVRIGGRTINPGETLEFPRLGAIPSENFPYGVEVFRGSTTLGTAPPPVPPTTVGTGFTITNVVPNATINLPAVLGGPGVYPINFKEKVLGSATSRTYLYTGTATSLGSLHHVWSGGSGFTLLQRISNGKFYTYYSGSVPMVTHEATEFSFSASGITGIAGWSGVITSWTGYTPPTAPVLSSGIISWQIVEDPVPSVLLPDQDYTSLPPVGYPLELSIWRRTTGFRDRITLLGNPSAAISGNLAVTIRSACVESPP